MNLAEWLHYIEQPHNITPGIERLYLIRHIAKLLELLPINYQVITVTGTNGKGSTVEFCSHILHAAGYKVGAYTSPHLIKYNERIAIQNQMVQDSQICEAFAAIEAARAGIELSYFEYSFLAALYIFKQHDMEVAVLEVGIGGRLDAVNAIDADVAVITTVDFDHMNFLGNTRAAIAFEKAGIFRAKRPAVYGDRDVPDIIYQRAKALDVPLLVLGKEFDYFSSDSEWSWHSHGMQYHKLPKSNLYLANAATALMALQCLGLPIPETAIKTGIQQTSLAGRQQIVSRKCQIMLDVAHNPQAARLLADKVASLPKKGRVYAIFSALSDKDISGVIAPLAEIIDHWHYAPLSVPRGATMLQLQQAFAEYPNTAYHDIRAAYQAVMTEVDAHDWVLIFGSFYTVATLAKDL